MKWVHLPSSFPTPPHQVKTREVANTAAKSRHQSASTLIRLPNLQNNEKEMSAIKSLNVVGILSSRLA